MKKLFKTGIAGFLFAFVFAFLTGIAAVDASAEDLSLDLDGDGKEELIEYASGDINSVSINGKEVFPAVKLSITEDGGYDFDVFTVDTATKDKYTEVVVWRYLENLSEYYVFRYNKGKISLYAFLDHGDAIVSQKTKNCIKIQTYVFVPGIGNIRVDKVFKVKKGKAVLKTKTYKPNKLNEATSFKSICEPIIFKSTDWTKVAGTIKYGDKFTLVKFTEDADGRFTQLYVKTKSGLKGWINTTDYDFSTFMVENPPLWN